MILFIHGRECRDCVSVRDLLVGRNVPFEESDIERTPNALQELVELTGSATHVPALIVDGEVFIEFGDENLTKIVDLSSQKALS